MRRLGSQSPARVFPLLPDPLVRGGPPSRRLHPQNCPRRRYRPVFRGISKAAPSAPSPSRPTAPPSSPSTPPTPPSRSSTSTSGTPIFSDRVPVGLEPVAVAARTNTEVWVVNHLSDSVSVVDLTRHAARRPHAAGGRRAARYRLRRQPGDRAFITTAHRGQQRTDPSLAGVPGAGDPQLTTPGVPRADVWVFDPANLGNTLGGTPLAHRRASSPTPARPGRQPRRQYGLRRRYSNPVTRPPPWPRAASASASSRDKPVHPGRRHRQPRRQSRPGHRLRGRAGARGRPDRQVQPGERPVGRRTRPRLGRLGPLPPARRRRLRHRRQHARSRPPPTPASAPRSSTWPSIPVERQALRLQHRGPQRGALRRAPASIGGHTVQGHLAESRITVHLRLQRRCPAT